MNRWTDADLPDLRGKRALITGAAGGIGQQAARALARHGAEVLLADRNKRDGAAAADDIRASAPSARAEYLPLDLANQAAVQDFTSGLVRDGKPLDLLINNAGIQPMSTRRTTGDGFELTFGIGHLGHFTLTAGLMPLLLKSPGPRVVTVSSLVYKAGYFDWDDLQMERGYLAQRPYNQTKLANLLFARELQRRATLAGTGLLSLAAHPGVARTAISASRREQGRFRTVDHLVSLASALAMSLLGQPAEAGAWPLLYAATAPDVPPGGLYGPGGWGELKGPPAPARIAPRGRDDVTAARLWQISEQLTGQTCRFDLTTA